MKVLFSIILSTIIFLASFQNSLLFVDYQINRDFYEIHCVNKAKPEMDCHGKCQMQKESEKTSTPLALVKYGFEFNILPGKNFEFEVKKSPLPFSKTELLSFDKTFVEKGFLQILPRPPQFCGC
ncbi:MAG: hypothetical protein ACOH1X_02365 [Kaistella sp.]